MARVVTRTLFWWTGRKVQCKVLFVLGVNAITRLVHYSTDADTGRPSAVVSNEAAVILSWLRSVQELEPRQIPSTT